MPGTKTTIAYHYRGGVERGIGGSYEWREGYSQGSADDSHVYYPWMTKRECQRDAKAQGATARFYRNGNPEKLS